jgi:ribose-phosphate pyrophosphokinase
MKEINLNSQTGIKTFLFPDNQPHVNIQGIAEGDEVKVTCSITDSVKMMQLLQVANALDNLFAKKKILVIPYLMAARFDRLMQHGDSIDLKVVANLINSCNFEKVYLFDVHSDVSTMLIDHSINVSNRQLVEAYNLPDTVLICPDAGASKKMHYYTEWNSNITGIVYCNKSRDLSTGKITLTVLEAEKCRGRNCVIIDDICDGGGTFIAIAEQVQPSNLTLIVTHGIFSKGFAELEKYFTQIIVSDSFCKSYDSTIVKQINAAII